MCLCLFFQMLFHPVGYLLRRDVVEASQVASSAWFVAVDGAGPAV